MIFVLSACCNEKKKKTYVIEKMIVTRSIEIEDYDEGLGSLPGYVGNDKCNFSMANVQNRILLSTMYFKYFYS